MTTQPTFRAEFLAWRKEVEELAKTMPVDGASQFCDPWTKEPYSPIEQAVMVALMHARASGDGTKKYFLGNWHEALGGNVKVAGKVDPLREWLSA